MARLRLFAAARDAAGCGFDVVPGLTVSEVLETACERYGAAFECVLDNCQIWCNGEVVAINAPVCDSDELAVLPPVSGG